MATPRDASANRASVLTPVGRGAVAVVAAEGAAALAAIDAHFDAANRKSLCDQTVNCIVFGHWAEGAHREEVVICRTAEVHIEVHCHGGVVAAERILAALAVAGCRIESWTEWVRADAACVLDAETEIALAAAATRRTAAILLDQRHGALSREIEALQQLLASSAVGAAAVRLTALVDRAAVGLHLTRPWQVAIAGRPNVGKSSLLNALVGYQRAIVFDQPGTTRDVLAAETAVDGWPVRLTDSAGLRTANDPLEAAGVALTKEQLARADLIVWVLDAAMLTPAELANPATTVRRELAEEVGDSPPVAPLVVVNKIDLVDGPRPSMCVRASALSGAGLDELLAAIAARLVPQPPAAGVAVPFTERQAALLREAAAHVAAGQRDRAVGELQRVIVGDAPAPNAAT